MDPYKTPTFTSKSNTPLPNRGVPCNECGSTNTGSDKAFRPKPSIIYFILFGWIALLIRMAFSKKTQACRDCGATQGERTAANTIALAILIIVVLLFILAYTQG